MITRSTNWFVIAGVALALAIAGCGGGGGGETSTGDDGMDDGTSGGDDMSTPTDVAWADMDGEQRAQFMQETVMPEMTAMFQELDGERYAELTCATCHGDNAQEVSFAMPNGVAPLDPTQIPAMFESDDPMAVLMTQRVWPRMAEMLGEPQFNPETGEGFSCLNCHATAEGG